MILWWLVADIAGAFVLSVAVIWQLLPVLRRVAIDSPNERSMHVQPVPRGAGLGVCAAIVATQLGLSAFHEDAISLWCIAAISVLALLGFADDRGGLSTSLRFVVTLAAALTVALALAMNSVRPFLLVVAVGVLLLTSFVNAFNFMDGINGISAITAIVVGGWYAGLGYVEGHHSAAFLGGAIAAGGLAFCPWNFPRARVFLGDSGSYGLGLSIGVTCIALWAVGVNPVLVVAPLALYFLDTGATIAFRALKGERVTAAHREHVYQRLAARYGHVRVTLGVGMLEVGACGLGEISLHWPVLGYPSAVLVAITYLVSPRMVGASR